MGMLVRPFKKIKLSKNKRLSDVLIPKTDPPLPLKEYYINTKKLIMEVRAIVGFFIGNEKVGVAEKGQCLWDTLVDVQSLFYTKSLIQET